MDQFIRTISYDGYNSQCQSSWNNGWIKYGISDPSTDLVYWMENKKYGLNDSES